MDPLKQKSTIKDDPMASLNEMLEKEVEITVKYLSCIMEARQAYREGRYTEKEYRNIITRLVVIRYQYSIETLMSKEEKK